MCLPRLLACLDITLDTPQGQPQIRLHHKLTQRHWQQVSHQCIHLIWSHIISRVTKWFLCICPQINTSIPQRSNKEWYPSHSIRCKVDNCTKTTCTSVIKVILLCEELLWAISPTRYSIHRTWHLSMSNFADHPRAVSATSTLAVHFMIPMMVLTRGSTTRL